MDSAIFSTNAIVRSMGWLIHVRPIRGFGPTTLAKTKMAMSRNIFSHSHLITQTFAVVLCPDKYYFQLSGVAETDLSAVFCHRFQGSHAEILSSEHRQAGDWLVNNIYYWLWVFLPSLWYTFRKLPSGVCFLFSRYFCLDSNPTLIYQVYWLLFWSFCYHHPLIFQFGYVFLSLLHSKHRAWIFSLIIRWSLFWSLKVYVVKNLLLFGDIYKYYIFIGC